MKVMIGDRRMFFTLSPATLEEYDLLLEFSKILTVGDELQYVGTKKTVPKEIKSFFVHPILWSKASTRYPTEIKLAFHGKELRITATDEEDEKNLWSVGFPLVFLNSHAVLFRSRKEQKTVFLDFLIGPWACKKCGKPSVDGRSMLYMCEECAALCPHDYKFFITIVPDKNNVNRIVIYPFCKMCLAPEPGYDPWKYSVEEHLELIYKKFGLRLDYASAKSDE